MPVIVPHVATALCLPLLVLLAISFLTGFTTLLQSGLEQLLLDQKIPGVLSRGAPVASISPPALYIPSLRAGIGTSSLLDCSVEVRWNDAPHGAGDGHLCLLLSAGCHVLNLRGSKKQKKQGWVSILFPFHL